MTGWVEWIACAFGLAGALLLAINGRYARYGWVLFIASNAGWIAYGYMTGAMGLVVQQIGFSITSALGIYQWFIKPRSQGIQANS